MPLMALQQTGCKLIHFNSANKTFLFSRLLLLLDLLAVQLEPVYSILDPIQIINEKKAPRKDNWWYSY